MAWQFLCCPFESVIFLTTRKITTRWEAKATTLLIEVPKLPEYKQYCLSIHCCRCEDGAVNDGPERIASQDLPKDLAQALAALEVLNLKLNMEAKY